MACAGLQGKHAWLPQSARATAGVAGLCGRCRDFGFGGGGSGGGGGGGNGPLPKLNPKAPSDFGLAGGDGGGSDFGLHLLHWHGEGLGFGLSGCLTSESRIWRGPFFCSHQESQDPTTCSPSDQESQDPTT